MVQNIIKYIKAVPPSGSGFPDFGQDSHYILTKLVCSCSGILSKVRIIQELPK